MKQAKNTAGKKNFFPAVRGIFRTFCTALGAFCLAAGTAFGAYIPIYNQNDWDLKLTENNVGNYVVYSSDLNRIFTHNGYTSPITITGTGAKGESALYLPTGNFFVVDGQINLNNRKEVAFAVGSKGDNSSADSRLDIINAGFLNVNGAVLVGGAAISTNMGSSGFIVMLGSRLFVSTDISIGGESDFSITGGSGTLQLGEGAQAIIAGRMYFGGESSTGSGGEGNIMISGGYLSAEEFVVKKNYLQEQAVSNAFEMRGTGLKATNRAVARLGNQHVEWLFSRKPALMFDNVLTIGNAVKGPEGGAAFDLSWAKWNIGGETFSYAFSERSLTVLNTKGIAAVNPDIPGILMDSGKAFALPPSFKAGSTIVLAMDGAKPGDQVIAFKDLGGKISSRWSNFYSSSRLVGIGSVAQNNNTITGILTDHDLKRTLPGASSEARAFLAAMAKTIGVDAGDDPAISRGQRFFSRATDYRFVEDRRESVRIVESALNAAALGGVANTTLSASGAGDLAIRSRITGAGAGTAGGALVLNNGTVSREGMSSGSSYSGGAALWAMPMFRYDKASKVKVGSSTSGYNSTMSGLSIGAEASPGETLRAGFAVNFGLADTRSTGALPKTKNDASFWGLSAYAGHKVQNFTLSGDIGYTRVFNDLVQNFPAETMLGRNSSNMQSSAVSAGLRADYRFKTEPADILPHVGVRYTGLFTSAYDLKNDGQPMLHVKSSTQNVWTFPVGVTFEKNIATSSGWNLKPQFDLGLSPAAGNLHATSRSNIPGMLIGVNTRARVVDPVTFDAGIGLDVFKNSSTIRVNYNFQTSSHRMAHAVFASFSHAF